MGHRLDGTDTAGGTDRSNVGVPLRGAIATAADGRTKEFRLGGGLQARMSGPPDGDGGTSGRRHAAPSPVWRPGGGRPERAPHGEDQRVPSTSGSRRARRDERDTAADGDDRIVTAPAAGATCPPAKTANRKSGRFERENERTARRTTHTKTKSAIAERRTTRPKSPDERPRRVYSLLRHHTRARRFA